MRSPPQQLPLALEFRPAVTAEDFWVASCNSLAVAWIDRWPDWPVPILSLSGPAGAGKSHLARVWAERSQAIAVDPGLFLLDLDALVAPAARLLIDLQATPFPGAETELRWFHLLNLLRERRGHALIVSRDPVTHWPVRLPDLASRLATLMQVEIGAPDDALLSALLVKHLADRGARVVDPGVMAYLLSRVERRFSVIAALARALNTLALAEQKPITLALARRVMQAHWRSDGDV